MIQIIRHQADDAPQAIVWAVAMGLAVRQYDRNSEAARQQGRHAAARPRRQPLRCAVPELSAPLAPLPVLPPPLPRRVPRFIPDAAFCVPPARERDRQVWQPEIQRYYRDLYPEPSVCPPPPREHPALDRWLVSDSAWPSWLSGAAAVS